MEPKPETREVVEWGMASANLLHSRREDDWRFEVAARVFVETELISPATRRAYLGQLVRGAKLLGLEFATDIRLDHLMLLRKAVMDAPASPASKAQVMAAWRGFLKWRCVRPVHGISREDIDDLLRPPRAKVIRPYDVLSRAETTKLLEQAGTLRDRAILLTMLGAGLRAAEVVGLDCGDIRLDADGEYFLLVHGKGRKDRQVPVHQEVGRLHQGESLRADAELQGLGAGMGHHCHEGLAALELQGDLVIDGAGLNGGHDSGEAVAGRCFHRGLRKGILSALGCCWMIRDGPDPGIRVGLHSFPKRRFGRA